MGARSFDWRDFRFFDVFSSFSVNLRILRSACGRVERFLAGVGRPRYDARDENDVYRGLFRRLFERCFRVGGRLVHRQVPILGEGTVDFVNRLAFRHFAGDRGAPFPLPFLLLLGVGALVDGT